MNPDLEVKINQKLETKFFSANMFLLDQPTTYPPSKFESMCSNWTNLDVYDSMKLANFENVGGPDVCRPIHYTPKIHMKNKKRPVEDVLVLLNTDKHGVFLLSSHFFVGCFLPFSWLPSSNLFGKTSTFFCLPGVPLQSNQGWDEVRDETAKLG